MAHLSSAKSPMSIKTPSGQGTKEAREGVLPLHLPPHASTSPAFASGWVPRRPVWRTEMGPGRQVGRLRNEMLWPAWPPWHLFQHESERVPSKRRPEHWADNSKKRQQHRELASLLSSAHVLTCFRRHGLYRSWRIKSQRESEPRRPSTGTFRVRAGLESQRTDQS